MMLGLGQSSVTPIVVAALPAGVPSTGTLNGYVGITGAGTATAPANYDAWTDGNGNVVALYMNGAWGAPTSPITLTAYEQELASAGAAAQTTGPTFSQGLSLWETPSTAFTALGSLSFSSANLAYTMGVLVPPVAVVGLLLMMMNGSGGRR